MLKSRQALPQGAELVFDGRKYRILEVMSENGGSCLVYKAERLSSEQQQDAVFKTKVVIKEFYPKAESLSRFISRNKNGELVFAEAGLERLIREKARFISGVAKQAAFYDEDSNYAMMGYPELYDNINGSAYSVLGLTNGRILGDINGSGLTVYEIAQIMTSLCNAVNKLHSKGKLYLDVKPDNVFLFNSEKGESRRIALFDFDTVVEKNNLPAAGFYSKGWSPDEQIFWNVDEITEASDVYAIGALFYWMLTGEKVPDELPTRILQGDFTFLDKCVLLQNMKNAKTTTKKLLELTLRRDYRDRAQNAGVLT